MTDTKLSRRQFSKAALCAAGAWATRSSFIRADEKNEKLNIAIIGCGGRGGVNLGGVSSQNIVALCDVNGKSLDAQGAKYPNAKKFTDFRKVFDDAKSFDAVVVSTCEHTHAFATLLAQPCARRTPPKPTNSSTANTAKAGNSRRSSRRY